MNVALVLIPDTRYGDGPIKCLCEYNGVNYYIKLLNYLYNLRSIDEVLSVSIPKSCSIKDINKLVNLYRLKSSDNLIIIDANIIYDYSEILSLLNQQTDSRLRVLITHDKNTNLKVGSMDVQSGASHKIDYKLDNKYFTVVGGFLGTSIISNSGIITLNNCINSTARYYNVIGKKYLIDTIYTNSSYVDLYKYSEYDAANQAVKDSDVE